MAETPVVEPRTPSRNRMREWLVRILWHPVFWMVIGVIFAGLRLALGTPPTGIGSAEFVGRWALFGLAYGVLVMFLRLAVSMGFGNGWTEYLAPALGLAFAWQFTGWFFTEDTVLQMFIVASVASIVLTPILAYLWHLFFE